MTFCYKRIANLLLDCKKATPCIQTCGFKRADHHFNWQKILRLCQEDLFKLFWTVSELAVLCVKTILSQFIECIFGELSLKGCSHQRSQRKKCSHPEQRLSHKINRYALIQTEIHFDKVRDTLLIPQASVPWHTRFLVWAEELRDQRRENSLILSILTPPLSAFIDCLK